MKVGSPVGKDPEKVFARAKCLYKNEAKKGVPFVTVFCVFDRDEHGTYMRTIDLISREIPPKLYVAITSVPCFEYWLLLHFKYVAGELSQAQAQSRLKKHLPDYEKNDSQIFDTLRDKLKFATAHAEQSLREARENDTDNPTTQVYKVVHEIVDFSLLKEN